MTNEKLEQLNQELELKRNKLAEQAMKLQERIEKGCELMFITSRVKRINELTDEIVELENKIKEESTITIQEDGYTVKILDSKVTIEGHNVNAIYSIVQNELLLRRNATIGDLHYYRENSKTLIAYWIKKGKTPQQHKDILRKIDQIVIDAVSSVNSNILYVQ